MNILEIYEQYRIMPQLAEHQLRVAAVGEMICDYMNVAVNKRNVVAALLLHDMGNIVKFNLGETLGMYPELSATPGLPYWRDVQREFREKYGTDSHQATVSIVKELGVSARILELVDSVGFEEGIESAKADDLEKKVCSYADERVAPYGVASLERRMADLRVRYRNHPEGEYDRGQFEQAMRLTEQQVFRHLDIKPEAITEEAIAGRKENLKKFQL